jgi:hypothetical protein
MKERLISREQEPEGQGCPQAGQELQSLAESCFSACTPRIDLPKKAQKFMRCSSFRHSGVTEFVDSCARVFVCVRAVLVR